MAAHCLTIACSLITIEDDCALIEKTRSSLGAPGWDSLIDLFYGVKSHYNPTLNGHNLYGGPFSNLYSVLNHAADYGNPSNADIAKVVREALAEVIRTTTIFISYGITSYDRYLEIKHDYIRHGKAHWRKRAEAWKTGAAAKDVLKRNPELRATAGGNYPATLQAQYTPAFGHPIYQANRKAYEANPVAA